MHSLGRLGRLRPSNMPRSVLCAAILCWLLAAVTAAILLSGTQPGVVFLLPVALIGCAVASAAFAASVALGTKPLPTRYGTSPAAVAISFTALSLIPLIGQIADRKWLAASVSAVCTVGAIALAISARRTRATKERSIRARAIGTAAGVMTPWALAGVLLAQSYANPNSPALGWLVTWRTMLASSELIVEVGAAAAIIGILSNRTLPPAADSSPNSGWTSRKWVLQSAAALVICIFVARLTFARGLFGPVDAASWQIGSFSGWPHAVVVALIIFGLTVQSRRKPVLQKGQTAALWALVLSTLAFSVVVFTSWTASAFSAAFWGSGPEIDFPAAVTVGNWSAIIVPAVIGVCALTPVFRGSSAAGIGLVALAYTVIVGVAIMSQAQMTPPNSLSRFASNCVEVSIVIFILVLIGTVADRIRKRGGRNDRLYLRLLVAPVLVVHAGQLIPAAVAVPLSIPLVVLGAAAALIWFLPPVNSDEVGNARRVLLVSAAQLTVLLVCLLSLTSDGSEIGAGWGMADFGRSRAIELLGPVLILAACIQVRAQTIDTVQAAHSGSITR